MRIQGLTRNKFKKSIFAGFVSVAAASCIHMPRTTAYDPNLSRTVIDGYPFHTEEYGDPSLPPLIILHGGPGDDFAYLRNLSVLKDSCHSGSLCQSNGCFTTIRRGTLLI